MEPVKVTIRIKGGMVEDVVCGPFVEVTVYDYDENTDPDEIGADEDGEPCTVSIWSHADDGISRHPNAMVTP